MTVWWSHASSRSHMFPNVSSQSLAPASCTSSAQDRHSQACFALDRAGRVIACVVSSCFVHRTMCACSVWSRMGMGVGYWNRSSSIGSVKERETVDLGRSQAVLYAWVHFRESLVSFASVQGMSGLRNLKVSIVLEMKISRVSLCSRRCPWMISVTSFVFKTKINTQQFYYYYYKRKSETQHCTQQSSGV